MDGNISRHDGEDDRYNSLRESDGGPDRRVDERRFGDRRVWDDSSKYSVDRRQQERRTIVRRTVRQLNKGGSHAEGT